MVVEHLAVQHCGSELQLPSRLQAPARIHMVVLLEYLELDSLERPKDGLQLVAKTNPCFARV